MNERMNECDELRDLLAAYGIGAADADEIQRLEDGLPRCPELSVELQHYRAMDAAIAARVPQAAPPPELLASLIVAARASQPAARPWLSWAATAAAVLLLIVSNLFWLSRSADSGLRQVDLPTAAEGEITGATGRVIWSRDVPDAVLFAEDFPGLGADASYQAWVRRGETVMSLGVFRVDDAGRGALTFDAGMLAEPFDILGVTREPLGGSPGPTSPPVVRWQSS